MSVEKTKDAAGEAEAGSGADIGKGSDTDAESGPESGPESGDATKAGQEGGAGGALDPLLLEILVCPSTKQALVYDRDRQELISVSAALAYPIRDGVPIMLIDEARGLSDAELAAAKARPKA